MKTNAITLDGLIVPRLS